MQLDTAPVFSAPYQAGLKTSNAEKAEMYKMLAENVNEATQMEQAARIVFPFKKDGTFQFCVDYRTLNIGGKWKSYAKPRIEEFLKSLCETTVV